MLLRSALLLCFSALAVVAQDVREFPGRVVALTRADVSNAVESTVAEIHFQPGQRVAKGDLLFTLDTTDFEQDLANAQAKLLHAETALLNAEEDYRRLRTLEERGSATGVQLLKAEVAQGFANAVRSETRAKVAEAQANLERTRIHAPLSGIISASSVNVGTYIKKGRAPLAHIVQLDPVRIAYQVPYVQRIEELNLQHLKFPENLLSQTELSLKISDDWVYRLTTVPSQIDAEVDPETGLITIWADIGNPDAQLRPGMSVTVVSRPRMNR
ncbi:efflux RND transporter periplasmic adaptor subunit [Lutimaribacter marinistellae]|uniref:Efflux RND transporter periplasmic adaptor subunit n=1 Tax=Lutimaribacter marinistellae TaxID=1820329 RepID=A0ABV7TK28_9RHOB